MDFDVIIAGGSFAGLAAAIPLRGRRVLLIEPHPIGAVQTSACGTLLAVLEGTDTLNSLLQVHDRMLLHLAGRTLEYPLPYPFCTFDYRLFCQRLLAQADVEVLRASVLGHRGHLVLTTRGPVDAELLIDATGWRAALATNGTEQAEHPRGKSFGLETTLPVAASGLHFYYDPGVLHPFAPGWLFPSGNYSRAGLASYRGDTQLSASLARFVQSCFGYPPNGRHGGYFPYRRRPATTDPVFRVGDAAGQCLPLTGEGIRPALYFGAAAGRLVQRVLAGELREPEALQAYRALVARHRRPYRYLLAAQAILPRLPLAGIERVVRFIQQPNWLATLLLAYRDTLSPAELMPWAGSETEATPGQPQRVGGFASLGKAG